MKIIINQQLTKLFTHELTKLFTHEKNYDLLSQNARNSFKNFDVDLIL